MKTVWWVLPALVGLATRANAQFSQAELQATGLTCAMCSNAVNRSLQQVSFVDSVRPDIRNSSFFLRFHEDRATDPDALKRAVEDAGFSVGALRLTGRIPSIRLGKDHHLRMGSLFLVFLNAEGRTLEGEHSLTVVDRGFVSEKQFRKYGSSNRLPCLQTGIAASCCEAAGARPGEKVYHVIL
ncbi:MAG: hypothetical protein RJA57_12 [Bacteroidota bacterium]|jgi:copper chaperone CopZ